MYKQHGIIKYLQYFATIHVGMNPAARTIVDARIILKLILKKWDGRR